MQFRPLHFGGRFEEREMEERVTAVIWGILTWRLIEIISKLSLADAIQFDLGLNLRLDSEIEHLPAPFISVLSFQDFVSSSVEGASLAAVQHGETFGDLRNPYQTRQ